MRVHAGALRQALPIGSVRFGGINLLVALVGRAEGEPRPIGRPRGPVLKRELALDVGRDGCEVAAVAIDHGDIQIPLRAAERDDAEKKRLAIDGVKRRQVFGRRAVGQPAQGSWIVRFHQVLENPRAAALVAGEGQRLAVGRPGRALLVEAVGGEARDA